MPACRPVKERVVAVVVTFERPLLLRRCLEALATQTRAPDAVVVVDNRGTGEAAALPCTGFPGVERIALPRNVGGAGGFVEGMRAALARAPDWVWLMDDDVAADPRCLAELLEVAEAAGKPVVVPRRLAPDGQDQANEAILVEATQRFEVVRADPARERYRLVDLFTFEGPLLRRSLIEAVGLPNPNVFIRGDDLLYAVAINRRQGALSCALAARAIVRRQLPTPAGVKARSRLKGWLLGNPAYELLPDQDHWKVAYELRNRHLLWRALGWRRRRRQLLIAHLGYLGVDLAHAMRLGWDWRLRLRCNAMAWYLGVMGRDTAFLDPRAYRARLAGRRPGGLAAGS